MDDVFFFNQLGVVFTGSGELKPLKQVELSDAIFFDSEPDTDEDEVFIVFNVIVTSVHVNGVASAVYFYLTNSIFIGIK